VKVSRFVVAVVSWMVWSPGALAEEPSASGVSASMAPANGGVVTAAAALPEGAARLREAATTQHVAELTRLARARNLAQDPQWLRLGHYRDAFFGGHKSEADGRAFFLSERGSADAQAELEATVAALFSAPSAADSQNHALCRFPARFAFLAQKLPLDTSLLPDLHCTKFDDFWAKVAADSVTVVFSSYYLNNPASAFGHTFLRLDKRRARTDATGRRELLDFGVDYAAGVPPGENAIAYTVKGLTGFYPGSFTLLPFFYKVREYNDLEARDLWEYRLSLAPSQLAMFVAHLWELGSTHFDYWYLSENCSYHILGALEVADPKLELIGKLKWPVIPSDTVKALLASPGLVADVHYRPALRAVLGKRAASMSEVELDAVEELVNDAAFPMPTGLSPARQVAVFDAAADLVDVRFTRKMVEDSASTPSVVKQRLLARRAAIPVVSEDIVLAPDPRQAPHLGHPSSRVMLGYGRTIPSPVGSFVDRSRPFAEIDFRLTLHDLADAPRGYPETAQIEFLPTRLRLYGKSPSLELEDISLVRVTSLTNQTRFNRAVSWRVRVGATRLHDSGCEGCVFPVGELGGGVSFGFFHDAVTLFGLAETRAYVGRITNDPAGAGPMGRLGVGPQLGMRLRMSDELIWLTTADTQWLPLQQPVVTWAAQSTLRWSYASRWAVDFEARAMPLGRDARLATAFYF